MIRSTHGKPHERDRRSVVAEGYESCRLAASTHYENFPVGSFLAPGHLRKHIHAIYAFARGADDIADEGSATSAERLAGLDRWKEQFDLCLSGTADLPRFAALGETIRTCGLGREEFDKLLTAFRMDAAGHAPDTFEDLLYYSRHSANPIGRLVLAVFGIRDPEAAALSDKLCSALQLANFWQDLSIDLPRGRRFLPLEDCKRFGYTFRTEFPLRFDESFRALLAHEVEQTKTLFAASQPLPERVPVRLRLELRATWNGGMTILRKIEEAGYNVLNTRPRLDTWDKVHIITSTLTGAMA